MFHSNPENLSRSRIFDIVGVRDNNGDNNENNNGGNNENNNGDNNENNNGGNNENNNGDNNENNNGGNNENNNGDNNENNNENNMGDNDRFMSINEALKIVSIFKGDKETLNSFIGNVETALEVVSEQDKPRLFRFVLTKIEGEPRDSIQYRDINNWQDLKSFLLSTYIGIPEPLIIIWRKCSPANKKKGRK